MSGSSSSHFSPCILLVVVDLALREGNRPLLQGPSQEVLCQLVEGRDIERVSFGRGTGGVLYLGSIHGS